MTGSDADELAQLPAYLVRYIHTRFRGPLDIPMGDGEGSIVPHVLEHRRETGLRYLAETVDRVQYGGLSVRELLDALAAVHESDRPSLLVGEVIDRLEGMSASEQAQLVEVLGQLHDADVPPRSRVWVDRAIHRLLPRFSATGSYRLAARCFVSGRAFRSRAAAKFYATFGLDDDARSILRQQVHEGTLDAPDLIVTDAVLVRELGLAESLQLASSTYYRKRAIELAMDGLPTSDVEEACRDYPQELVWAVHDQRRRDYLPTVSQMLAQYGDDPYLINRVVGCIGRIGGKQDIQAALEVARGLMALGSVSPVDESA